METKAHKHGKEKKAAGNAVLKRNSPHKMGDLSPNPENPRKITEEELSMLRKSMDEFGDINGVVFNIETGNLTGGHQRGKIIPADSEIEIIKTYDPPTKKGTVAEGFLTYKGERFSYREVSWGKEKEIAANIAANQHGGDWHFPALTEHLNFLDSFNLDMDLVGFSRDDLADIMCRSSGPSSERENEIPELKKKTKIKVGNLFSLGAHRLLCGDSTNPKQLARLLDGEKAQITFTSPPYNANTTFQNTENDGPLYDNYDDNLSSEEYLKFMNTVLGLAIKNTSRWVFWNVNYNANSRFEFIKQIVPFIEKLEETICWKKIALPIPAGLTRTWEPIFVFRCHTDPKARLGTKNETHFNYWDINNCSTSTDSHRAAFPVELPERAILLTPGCKSVLDLFMGSGTTLIAAQKRGIASFGMELSPEYVQVCVDRWEEYTGEKAKKI